VVRLTAGPLVVFEAERKVQKPGAVTINRRRGGELISGTLVVMAYILLPRRSQRPNRNLRHVLKLGFFARRRLNTPDKVRPPSLA
jgi:hypothetical protein